MVKERRRSELRGHPMEVLRYAARNGYNYLADRAAPLTLDSDWEEVKSSFEENSYVSYGWV